MKAEILDYFNQCRFAVFGSVKKNAESQRLAAMEGAKQYCMFFILYKRECLKQKEKRRQAQFEKL